MKTTSFLILILLTATYASGQNINSDLFLNYTFTQGFDDFSSNQFHYENIDTISSGHISKNIQLIY